MANTGAVHPPGKAIPGDRQTRFCFIDALRGIAALGIVLHHLNIYGPLRATLSQVAPRWVWWTDEWCWAGVQVFFVISGLVIAYSLRGARITPAFVGNFALRRSIRLDPSYWVVIALVLALHFLPELVGLPSPHSSPITAGQVVAHVFYLQYLLGYGESFSAGFWTLCIEMQFYLLFCLMLGLAQRLTPFGKQDRAAGWALAIVFFPLATASLWVFNLDHRYEDWVLFFFCMFFLGSIVWWTLEGRLSPRFLWAYVGLMVARLAWQWGIEIAVALAAGLVIYGVGRVGHLTDWLRWRPLMYLGRISYSLYLIHYSVIHLVVHAGHRLTGDAPGPAFAWTAAAFVLSLVAAHVLNVLVEAPTARLSARLKQRPALIRPAGAPQADGEDSPALSVGQA
ncbi:MAG TPA: acyltransferase [Pirellulales bacterium]|jgi:peptidoglycan/LPS O-acetylase OafA/YrhL|nr:acyltransferase [Pirellulales bacterium]